MEKSTIELSNGVTLANLEINGNNYITLELISEATFEGGLAPVIIDGEEHEQMALVQCITHSNGKTWFILRDISAKEIAEAKLRADIDFLALMTDVEL